MGGSLGRRGARMAAAPRSLLWRRDRQRVRLVRSHHTVGSRRPAGALDPRRCCPYLHVPRPVAPQMPPQWRKQRRPRLLFCDGHHGPTSRHVRRVDPDHRPEPRAAAWYPDHRPAPRAAGWSPGHRPAPVRRVGARIIGQHRVRRVGARVIGQGHMRRVVPGHRPGPCGGLYPDHRPAHAVRAGFGQPAGRSGQRQSGTRHCAGRE